ncbi:17860_t:CDS:2 [Rhizophagus irregularis]|nr:17860_t:CDS:2 [Rhizophagus irregularis]
MRYHHCQKLSGCNDYILQLNEALQVDPHSKKLLDLKRKWKDNEYRDDWEGYEDKKRSRKADLDERLKAKSQNESNNDDAEIFNDLDINNEGLFPSSIDNFRTQKNFYNTIRTLENEWGKIEANLQKTIEERWNVSKTKQLVVTLCYNLFFHIRTRQFLRYRSAKDASELRYRLEIVNLLLAGAFEMTERSMWLETGEIENEIQKVQRNDTKGDINERSKLGMKHDGMINMIIDGKKYQVGFLEVVGNAFNKNITD